MNLIDCINFNLMTPYVDRMISDFLGTSSDDPRVANVVGMLIGIYPVCEVLFSVFWGALSDRVGRRSALLVGLGGSVLAPILMGFARSLPMAFAARMLDGFFCGNVGITKTYLGEIADHTNEARAFSFLALCFSMGLLIGPLIGGNLVDPASWAPSIFGGTVFETYPYLLPNISYASLAALAWLLGLFSLEETLPRGQRQRGGSGEVAGGDGAAARRSWLAVSSPLRALQALPPNLMRVVACYCMLSGYAGAWIQNFIEMVSLPRRIDGFALSPREIGLLQNVAAIGLLLSQLLLYPRLTRRWGYMPVFVVGGTMNVAVTLLFPAYGLLADPDRYHGWRFVPLACMQFFGQVGFGFCFPTTALLVNREASKGGLALGVVNGWCQSLGALCRALVPPAMATLLPVGLALSVPGGRYLAIFATGCFAVISILLAVQVHLRPDGSSGPARQAPLMRGDGAHGDAKGVPLPDGHGSTAEGA